jgi:serine/threonine-protein kinase
MSLNAGTRVGPYEIVAQLGAGGMGEVYQARDARLGRDVALKILPDAFAADADRLMRFEREAKTLAALNHPNIAQIHGLEDAGRTRALVMELIDGEDLAERLARGAIPLDEALPIARQIAEALEAAHDAGIVHRDLKPANIKMRDDGTVKVLDFGLAKPGAAGGTSTAADLNSPTITTPAMTLQGMILGTAAYMAPEQAKGRTVDKRADVWAFGCVFYEMLTGRRAFVGEDVSDTMAAILRGEPDWRALPVLPPAVLTLIKRSLERDPRRRISSMSAVRYVLEDPAAAAPPVPVSATPPAPVVATRPRTPIVAVAALAIGAALGVLAATLMPQPAPTPQPVTRFQFPLPEGQVLSMARRMMALSPDGTAIAYITETQLFTRRLSEFNPSPVSEVGRAMSLPTYSPDGAWLAFYSALEGALMRVSTAGGTALRVCTVPAPITLTWDSTGLLLGSGDQGILRCLPTGGTPEVLVKARPGETLFAPQTLPGGDRLLFTIGKLEDPIPERWDRAEVVIESLRSGERRTVINGGSDALFLPSGHLLYGSAGMLFGVPFDADALETRGEPVPVVEGIMRSTTGPMQLSVSAAGTLAYVPGPTGTATNVRELAIADRLANVTRLPLPAGSFVHVRASRDGTRLAIATDDGKDAIVWVYALDGKSALRRLTLEGRNDSPIWSPDGQWIAFQSERASGNGIYRQRADGTGAAERLTTSSDAETHVPESWSPDGLHVSYATRRNTPAGTEYKLWVLSMADRRATAFGAVTSTQPIGSAFSPDGRWVAYTQSPTEEVTASNRGVFVQPFPATGAVFQVPRQLVDFHPVWTRDGKEIVFLASATAMQMAAVGVSATTSLTFGTPVRFPASVTGERLSNTPRAFDLLPDGRFVGVIQSGESDTRGRYREVRMVLNWTAELAQRFPAQ